MDAKIINKDVSEVNGKIYEVLVNKFNVPRDAIVNINIDYELSREKQITIKDIEVEVYDRDDILSRNATRE